MAPRGKLVGGNEQWEAGDTRAQEAGDPSDGEDEWEHVGSGHGPIEEVSEEWLAGLDVDSRKRVIKERLFNHERQKASQLEQVCFHMLMTAMRLAARAYQRSCVAPAHKRGPLHMNLGWR